MTFEETHIRIRIIALMIFIYDLNKTNNLEVSLTHLEFLYIIFFKQNLEHAHDLNDPTSQNLEFKSTVAQLFLQQPPKSMKID